MSDSENETRKVGQMVGKGNSTLELIYGSLSGMAFGLISPMASQPFDTIKTKMQADARFANQGSVAVGRAVLKTEGLAGLYRGMLPILASTGVQKAALFAGYAGGRRWCEESGISALSQPMPFTGGLSPSVIVGSVASATARTVVETPFELAKVRSQTGGSFKSSQGVFSVAQIAELYTGAFATWARGAVMLTSFFVFCDYSERMAPELMSQPLVGGFIKGGLCATLAWGIAWPMEVVKSKVQAAEGLYKGQSMTKMMVHIAKTDGPAGLFRGFAPGAMRSFVANGGAGAEQGAGEGQGHMRPGQGTLRPMEEGEEVEERHWPAPAEIRAEKALAAKEAKAAKAAAGKPARSKRGRR
eukprot:jgi/Tetstr1/445874/TSEL_033513.t1